MRVGRRILWQSRGEEVKIGFEVWDGEYHDLDFSAPLDGNPGIGGTTYAMLTLAYSYQAKHSDVEVFLIHSGESNKFWDGAQTVIKRKDSEIDKILDKTRIDIYISANAVHDDSWYQAFERREVAIVYILGNFLTNERSVQYKHYNAVKRVVFVGREQYDKCLDDDIIEIADVIGNIIGNKHEKYRNIEDVAYNVTYMGALLPQKGFHLLAKQWKKILKKVPDAQLYVIGSGKLYNEETQLGKFGISTERYEEQFMPYLLDENGKILDSVHFMGVMGKDKEDIFLKTAVGVPNPSGESETFCNCAVEMQGYGIPIVTVAKNSFFDVVANRKSGFLFYTEFGFRHKIIKLLLDKKENEKKGIGAKKNSDKFTEDELIPKWHQLFQDIRQKRKATYIRPSRHIFYDKKYIRIINRILRIDLGIRCLPSSVEGLRSGLKKR